MFFVLLGIALLLLILLQKKADRLSTAKPANSLKVTGILAIATMVSFAYAHLRQPESKDKGIETFGAKEGDIMVKIPKRLFDPKRWFEVPVEKSLNEYNQWPKIPFSNLYDRKLIIHKNFHLILAFTMDTKDSLEYIFQKSKIKSDFKGRQFREYYDHHLKCTNGTFSTTSNSYLPFSYLTGSFTSPTIHSDKFRQLVPNLQAFTKASIYRTGTKPPVFRSGLNQTTFSFNDTGSSSYTFCIPFQSEEEFIEVSLEKCLSLLFPHFRSSEYENLSSTLNKNKENAEQSNNWICVPLFAKSYKMFLLVIILAIGLIILKQPKPGLIIMTLLLCLAWFKYYDFIYAGNLGYLDQNRYALPKARKLINQQLSELSPFSVAYDTLKTKQAISKLTKYPAQIATSTESFNGAFEKITFSDGHQLINLQLIANQTITRENMGSGGGFSQSYFTGLYPLIIQKIMKLRAHGETANSFLFDPRHFAIRPVKSPQRPDESEDAWLRREFTAFFTDLFQTETNALETAQ